MLFSRNPNQKFDTRNAVPFTEALGDIKAFDLRELKPWRAKSATISTVIVPFNYYLACAVDGCHGATLQHELRT